jgi:Uma2 family endonuclease
MTAAPVASPPGYAADVCVVLPRVSWETYERLLADDEERRVPRMTYDRGVLELVTPSMPHEEDALVIALTVEIVAAVLGIPIRRAGSTTYRRADLERGFELDGSFSIQNAERIRGRRQVDLRVDPPPDVVLEMKLTPSAVDKLALFDSMGVPEVWRWDGARLAIPRLTDAGYRETDASAALPPLTSDDLTRFLANSRRQRRTVWFREPRTWASAAS